MTLIEVLTAVAVASVFLVGIVTALSSILRAAQIASNTGEATRNARHALNVMSRDVAEANTFSGSVLLRFEGIDAPLPFGDRRDNDGDGATDEEAHDGRDNDGDASIGTANHALLRDATGTDRQIYERPRQTTFAEVGDAGVDEDVVFNRDVLTFIRRLDRITYEIGTFEGEENVLLRRVAPLITPVPVPPPRLDPVAFNVVSFNVLYFDPNWLTAGAPTPWTTAWNSVTSPGPIRFPATVHVSVTVYSGDIPLAEVAPTAPLDTVTLETQIALESILPTYRAQF